MKMKESWRERSDDAIVSATSIFHTLNPDPNGNLVCVCVGGGVEFCFRRIGLLNFEGYFGLGPL